ARGGLGEDGLLGLRVEPVRERLAERGVHERPAERDRHAIRRAAGRAHLRPLAGGLGDAPGRWSRALRGGPAELDGAGRPTTRGALRRQPNSRRDQMLGKPTAGTVLAGVPLCLRPEERYMLLSDDVSSLDVVEKHSTLLHVS